ncbi:MAG: DUF5791 family protein [Salinarchaeum sp.]
MLREDRTVVSLSTPDARVAAYREWSERMAVDGACVDASTSLAEASRQWAHGIEEPVAPETIATEAREVLLVGMARTMMDIGRLMDTLEHTSDCTWTRQSVRAKLSGSASLSLGEYAAIEHAIARHRAES